MPTSGAFVPLDPGHFATKAFDCGKPELNQFISRYAFKNMRLGLSSTWVLGSSELDESGKLSLAAYYTLASSTVTREEIPNDKSLPGYPVPLVLLARLAVDKCYQGQRLGEKTLVSALRQSVILTARGLPALGLVLDAMDEEALTFYKKFEIFQPFTDNPMRLFVSMSVLRQL